MTLPRLLACALAAFLSAQCLAAAPTQVVDSSIESVSLFRDGAQVTRSARIEAPGGKSILRFENLPTNVDVTAVQATIGDAAGVIRNAKLFQPQNPEESEAMLELQKKLEAHKRLTREIEEEANIARARIKFVEAMSSSFAKGYGEISENGESLDLNQGLRTWELVDQTRREAQKTIEDVNERLSELSKKETELQQALRDAQEKDVMTRSVAEVEIELDSPQTLTLSLSYQALSAWWRPQYELRAKPQKAQLDFGYFASVWQQTGEDWKDVTLSLHTNQANRRGNVPELSPMNLQRASPPRYSSDEEEVFELSPFAVDASSDGYRAKETRAAARMQASAQPPPPPSQQAISVTASSVSFEVTLPSSVSVPSAKDETVLTVTKKSFETNFWSETVPRLQLDAYLRAKAVNTLELPILPGIGLAFVNGTLSSKVSLSKTLPGEELEISLGTDSNIVVKRIEGAQEDKNSGFLDKTVTLSRSYTNMVTSYHAVPHKIVVVDQFPIATDAKIEITRNSPKEDAVVVKEENKDNGIFQWEATIAPQTTLSFVTDYTVVHPRDWYIHPTP